MGLKQLPRDPCWVGEYYEFVVTAKRGALESAQVCSLLIREARKLLSPGAPFIHLDDGNDTGVQPEAAVKMTSWHLRSPPCKALSTGPGSCQLSATDREGFLPVGRTRSPEKLRTRAHTA